jgi:hypothetical protein
MPQDGRSSGKSLQGRYRKPSRGSGTSPRFANARTQAGPLSAPAVHERWRSFSAPAVRRHSPGNVGNFSAPAVHERPAEVEVRLVLVVCGAAQLDVFGCGPSPDSERLPVVELHVARRSAATSERIHVAAASAVASPYFAPYCRRNGSLSLFSLLGRWNCSRSVFSLGGRWSRSGSHDSRGSRGIGREGYGVGALPLHWLRAIGATRPARERPIEQDVDRPTDDRRRIASGRGPAEQILQRPKLVVRCFVDGDLDLVAPRAERNDRLRFRSCVRCSDCPPIARRADDFVVGRKL